MVNDYSKTGKHLCEACGEAIQPTGGFVGKFIVCFRCWCNSTVTVETIAASPRKNTDPPEK